MGEFNEVTYDILLDYLGGGSSGSSIESLMKSYSDSGTEGDYTVYWPKDSIRVISGADYGTARTIACILRDKRTRWMGKPTTFAEPVIARIRRPLDTWATFDQVETKTIYVKDKLLPADISCVTSSRRLEQAEFPKAPYRFDFASLPEEKLVLGR